VRQDEQPTRKALPIEQVEDAKQLPHIVLHRSACTAQANGDKPKWFQS
jgi:hypothetical protein